MKTYSTQIAGVLIAFAGITLVQFGFSDSCSNEIVAKLAPIMGALPGLLTVYIGRLAKGDVKLSGVKKQMKAPRYPNV